MEKENAGTTRTSSEKENAAEVIKQVWRCEDV